jgi:hypothetical protein
LDEPAIDIIVNEGTDWLKILSGARFRFYVFCSHRDNDVFSECRRFDILSLRLIALHASRGTELRNVCGVSSGGLSYGGMDVREDLAYRKMIRDELKEKYAVTNLKGVDAKVLNTLRSSLKEDPKQVGSASMC